MAIESIGSVVGNSSAALQAAGIGQEDFLKILLTQLSFQDPLKPLDNQEFIAQMAQFTSLEQARQLNDRTDALLSIQSATQSISLIGRTVEVRTDTGTTVGQVTTITFEGGSPSMTVQTSSGAFLTGVTLSQIFVVR
jgi:flagellar basal-body rod modification protein FlgD